MKKTILIVEDDMDIINLVKLYIEGEGFNTVYALNGKEGLDLINEEISCIIADIMMPVMDGYEFVKKAKLITKAPIMIMSAKTTDNDKILGLNIGADDYITKPFNPLEMVARVKALLRRNQTNAIKEKVIKYGLLSLNTESCKLFVDTEEVLLTATEYKIVHLLLKSPGRVYTKGQIAERINGDYYDIDDNSITVHISRLRTKIGLNKKGESYIKTVIGLGYKIEIA